MPARAIPNGQTVTLRLDADLVFKLKVTALESHLGLSELCGAILTAAVKKGDLPKPRPKLEKPYLSQIPKVSKPGSPKGKRGKGDKALFKQLQHLIEKGTIRQADVAKAAGISPANYRASWMKTQWVPAKYVDAVVRFLEAKGIRRGTH
jgi:hypothetical protein